MRGRQTTFPPRYHMTHASKHVSSGRGLMGDGPPRKGIVGDAASRKGNLGAAAPSKGILGDMPSTAVPPALSHFHHKPAAPLYGPVTVLHKPFAGGDGHPRKPAKHIGIPQVKKPDKFAVRCTWTNDLVQRTVMGASSNQPSASAAKVYRAPTPPQCSTVTDDEYPGRQEDLRRKEELRRKLERIHLRAAPETSVFPFHFC